MQRGDLEYRCDASGRRIISLAALRALIARRNAGRGGVPELADNTEHRQRRIEAAESRLATL